MVEQLPNYLRSHRKRTGLSQQEVAFLLGVQSGAKISRYERFVRTPSLPTAFAFALIFDTEVETLFAGLAEEAERVILRRARLLKRRLLARAQSPALARKLAVLRAVTAPTVEEVRYEPLPQQ